MKIIKAYWLRWWHCLYFSMTRGMHEDHRLTNQWIGGKVAHIGCQCGKVYYHRKFIDIYHELYNYKPEEKKSSKHN